MTTIRAAIAEDAAVCARIAEAAYQPYVADIGRRPMPMDQDFVQSVQAGALWVAEADGRGAGYVVACPDGDAWLLENVAVDPGMHGSGLGRALIGHVEAMAGRAGAVAVELYTNARMTRNLSLYPALGYAEIARARQDGFDRVFFRKTLRP